MLRTRKSTKNSFAGPPIQCNYYYTGIIGTTICRIVAIRYVVARSNNGQNFFSGVTHSRPRSDDDDDYDDDNRPTRSPDTCFHGNVLFGDGEIYGQSDRRPFCFYYYYYIVSYCLPPRGPPPRNNKIIIFIIIMITRTAEF